MLLYEEKSLGSMIDWPTPYELSHSAWDQVLQSWVANHVWEKAIRFVNSSSQVPKELNKSPGSDMDDMSPITLGMDRLRVIDKARPLWWLRKLYVPEVVGSHPFIIFLIFVPTWCLFQPHKNLGYNSQPTTNFMTQKSSSYESSPLV